MAECGNVVYHDQLDLLSELEKLRQKRFLTDLTITVGYVKFSSLFLSYQRLKMGERYQPTK